MTCLLAHAYPTITTALHHTVTTVEIRNWLGSHESNDRIKAILRKLGRMVPDINFVDLKGEERETFGGLIFGSVPKGDGIIRFFFHPELVPFFNKPAVFARIKLAILCQFRNKYAPAFYENLELYTNREIPIWDVAVDELRSILGVGDKMKVFTEFRRYVLNPALQEINDKADFNVTVVEIKSKRRGRTVERLVFTVETKEERDLVEAELRHKPHGSQGHKLDKKRNEDTPDFFDGRTDKERGGQVPLRTETYEMAREIFEGWERHMPDIYSLERDWRAYEAKKSEPARDPDKAFLGWLRKYRNNHQKDRLFPRSSP
ncbi:hypothetical protein CCP3SC15_1260001 [Gammaproteobacteria bacterium]